MRLSSRDRARATVAYADIFDYPLTKEETRLWSIGEYGALIRDDVLGVVLRDGVTYISLKKRERLVAIRTTREKAAREKWDRATKIGNFFRWIPSVHLVGVTGGLAMENAKTEDDIDVFFITGRDTLWISRLLVTLVAQMLGVRRVPGDTSVANKICLNMFMAEDSLALSVTERDLFAAHEILQMRPLWERDGAYRKFLQANRWVARYLPNAWMAKNHESGIMNHGKEKYSFVTLIHNTISMILRLAEHPARLLQLWYMHKRRTREVIEPGVLRFHPVDARTWVRNKYAKRLKKLNLPLDKIFYHG